MNQEEKFHEEKDKIVQILEAGFAQREKHAVEKCEEDLTKKFESNVQAIRDEHEQDKEKFKNDQEEALTEKLNALTIAQDSKLRVMLEEAKATVEKKCTEDKELALKQQHQQLTMKAKREVDALRARFKVMQSTGALLDRSPSVSESDSLSLEVSLSKQTALFFNASSRFRNEHTS